MALEFLNTINNLTQAVTPVAQGVANLRQALGPSPYDQAYQATMNEGPTTAEQRAGSLYEALLQPGNSLMSHLTNDNMQTGMQNFMMQLKQMQMMDARRQGRGLHGTFFNPERADETVSYLTSRGMPAIQQQASTNARNQVMQSANAINGQATLESQRRQRQLSAMQTNAALQTKTGGTAGKIGQVGSGVQSLTTGIQGLLKAFGIGQQQAPSANFVGPMPEEPSIFSKWFG